MTEGDAVGDFFVGNLLLGFVRFSLEFEPGHDHPGNPEEDDVGTRNESRSRIEMIECLLLHFRFPGPTQGGQRPKPGRSPGIQNVFVLLPFLRIGRAGCGHVPICRVRTDGSFLVPDRNPVSPPELPADAPVLNVFEPMQIRLFPSLGEEFDMAVPHRLFCFLHPRVFEEPLLGQPRFDGDARPLGIPDVVLMFLLVEQVAVLGKFFDHVFAGRKSIHAHEVATGQLVERPVRVEDVDHGQVVPLGDLEIEPVMGGSNFENARAKVLFHRLVRNDRDCLWIYWARGVLAFERLPTRILGVDCQCDVSHDGFGAGGGNLDEGPGGLEDPVFDLVKGTVLRLHDHLFVGQRRQACRTPVDHSLTPVDVTFVEEFDKGLDDGLGIVVVQGMRVSVPVTGASQFA